MEKQKLEENCFSPEISFWMKLQNSKKIPYHTRSEIFETIFQGGMPDVVSGAAERNAVTPQIVVDSFGVLILPECVYESVRNQNLPQIAGGRTARYCRHNLSKVRCYG